MVTKHRGPLTTQFGIFIAGALSSGCVDLRSSIMANQRQGWCGLCRAGARLRCGVYQHSSVGCGSQWLECELDVAGRTHAHLLV